MRRRPLHKPILPKASQLDGANGRLSANGDRGRAARATKSLAAVANRGARLVGDGLVRQIAEDLLHRVDVERHVLRHH